MFPAIMSRLTAAHRPVTSGPTARGDMEITMASPAIVVTMVPVSGQTRTLTRPVRQMCTAVYLSAGSPNAINASWRIKGSHLFYSIFLYFAAKMHEEAEFRIACRIVYKVSSQEDFLKMSLIFSANLV